MIDKIKSFYLDFIRLIASLYVFTYHIGTEQINGIVLFSKSSFKYFWKFQDLSAHYFVIVFFVLSGFLITMSVSKPGITIKGFFIARLGRLYSVLIPSLILSFAVYLGLIFMNVYTAEEIVNNKHLFLRFIINLTFLSQSFNFFSVPPINAPFWSISYEFMYYVIIAVMFLIKGWKKYVFIIVFSIIAGLKILLLFPCWLIGSILFYVVREKKFLKNSVSIVLFALTTVLLFMIVVGDIIIPFQMNPSTTDDYLGIRLFYSTNFIADYLFGLLFALNMYSFFGLSRIFLQFQKSKIFKCLDKSISTLSNCSFTLYLFHMPLLFLFSAIWFYDKTNYYHQIGLIGAVLVSVYFIAQQTEWKVDFWRKTVLKIINSMENIYNSLFYKKQTKNS